MLWPGLRELQDIKNSIACAVFVASLIVVFPCPSISYVYAAENVNDKGHLTFSTFPSEGMGVLFTRILTEAYHKVGYEVTIRGYPAERALAMSNDGLVDGEAGRVPVIEGKYKNLIRVPTPIYTNRVFAFSRQPKLCTNKGWSALEPYKLGAVIGYKFIEKMTKDMNSAYFRTYRVLFKALDNDRIDVAISEYLEALPIIRDLRLQKIGAHHPPLAHNEMHHYLHKKHKKLVPVIDAVLQEMYESGRMDTIQKELEAEYKR